LRRWSARNERISDKQRFNGRKQRKERIIKFSLNTKEIEIEILDVVIAGWTGRDRATVEKHIDELEALGVRRPENVPCFYRVGRELITQNDAVDVLGTNSSGEVEFFMVSDRDGLWIGIGSDHTDRKVETIDVGLSKQICPKPVGHQVWRYEDIKGHWDRLKLRSWTGSGTSRDIYQEGSVSNMLPPEELIHQYMRNKDDLPVGTLMFGGTLAVKGEIRSGDYFEVELEDPVKGRVIWHRYMIRRLPSQIDQLS